MRVLITNNTLEHRSGTELFVRDLAIALIRRGHEPVAYSTRLGSVAEELRASSVPVIDDLRHLTEPPDVIHGQHHLDTVSAVLRFPNTPAISVCHGWLPWEETPVRFPTILRHVAVDDLCRERLLTSGLSPAQVATIYNAVDTARFVQRPSLPARPGRALVFSNHANPDGYVAAIRAGCVAAGIEQVDVAGIQSGHIVAAPEALLPSYDVVFAKARGAMEAMAVGCAVVVADVAGLAGLVTPANVDALRRLNFGLRTMQAGTITAESVCAALEGYDPDDASAVSSVIREQAGLSGAVDQWVALYETVLAEWTTAGRRDDDMASAHVLAAAAYLPTLAERLKGYHDAAAELRRTRDVLQQARAQADALHHALASKDAAQRTAEGRLAEIAGSRAWRIVQRCRRALRR